MEAPSESSLALFTPLSSWGAIELGRHLHLVGVRLGRRRRLSVAPWMVTSRLRFLNQRYGLTIAVSIEALYQLRQPIEGAWPDDALDAIACAMHRRRMPGQPPTAPIPLLTSYCRSRSMASMADLAQGSIVSGRFRTGI
jgi:hypothetical protein